MSKNLAYGCSLYDEMCIAPVTKPSHTPPLPKSELRIKFDLELLKSRCPQPCSTHGMSAVYLTRSDTELFQPNTAGVTAWTHSINQTLVYH